MDPINLDDAFDNLKFGENVFHELMNWRIRRILLVLPHYDAWILEHDAKLTEQIVGEYHQLNLTTVPRLVTVPDGRRALEILERRSFDLMITGMRVGDMTPGDLAKEAKSLRPDLATLLLLSSRSDLTFLPVENFDAPFLWTGDSRLFLGMIKFIEDKKNAPTDTEKGLVRVLLVVEDSVSFYSAYLPLLYGEIMGQTQRLIAEEMNDTDKYFRMRSRPKIILARDWEEATALAGRYRDALIGVISDIEFRREGVVDAGAGLRLLESLNEWERRVPVLLQSSDADRRNEALDRGARFQAKGSPDLLRGIRRFLLDDLGFGDFVFRDPKGNEIKRVKTLRGFEKAIADLPPETLAYHGDRDDYSTWLGAHGEHQVARRLKPLKTTDFQNPEAQRKYLARSFREVRESRIRGRLVDFRPDDPGVEGSVARIGSGSLGGKGRGLAFFNALLAAVPWEERFPRLTIRVPRAVIIGTSEYDRFLDESGLPGPVKGDDELRDAFLKAPLPVSLVETLEAFLVTETGPLAVRSSSLLEDSQSLPFAGVYETYMLPGGDDWIARLKVLLDAVRLVWASVFTRSAVAYRNALGVGREEEKMAVIIQKVTGSGHDGLFYPRLSGTAQSINYYPVGPMERQDGAARIALGLGHTVVGGGRGFLFCPNHPAVPYGSEEDRWREGQSHFWALDLSSGAVDLRHGDGATLRRPPVREAEVHGTLRHLASTWDPDGGRIRDGLDTPGPRVLDFKDILEYEWIPLSPLLGELLDTARIALGAPVELEYAVDWDGDAPQKVIFSLLQVRPLTSLAAEFAVPVHPPEEERLLLFSTRSLGHGIVDGIRDIVWVDTEKYDPGFTEELRDEVASLVEKLAEENRPAIVIGPGRWGSRDRFLGIPVSWAQVRQAKLIVETSRGEGDPEPSQGSHFFHNLVALGVGYAHIPSSPKRGGFVDEEWLRSRAGGHTGAVHLIRSEIPLRIVMDGRKGRLWVEKGRPPD